MKKLALAAALAAQACGITADNPADTPKERKIVAGFQNTIARELLKVLDPPLTGELRDRLEKILEPEPLRAMALEEIIFRGDKLKQNRRHGTAAAHYQYAVDYINGELSVLRFGIFQLQVHERFAVEHGENSEIQRHINDRRFLEQTIERMEESVKFLKEKLAAAQYSASQAAR